MADTADSIVVPTKAQWAGQSAWVAWRLLADGSKVYAATPSPGDTRLPLTADLDAAWIVEPAHADWARRTLRKNTNKDRGGRVASFLFGCGPLGDERLLREARR
mgnify:CR=1 FL=1